jgi:broad specificity phosphatase PhoE
MYYHCGTKTLQKVRNCNSSYITALDVHVAVFGHGVAIKCLLRGIMEFSANITWKIALDNTSITELGFDHRGWHLLRVNDVAHLHVL